MKASIVSNQPDFKLSHAVLLYSTAGGPSFASIHPVTAKDGLTPVIGPGSPATIQAIRSALQSLLPPDQKPSLLDCNVLTKGSGMLCWFKKPALQEVWFKSGEFEHGVRKVVPLPGLVFLADNKSLYVWAYRGKGRPTVNTCLYHAPLYNVWRDGKVCTGSAVMPDPETATSQDWEKAFFSSWFTHANHNQLVKGVAPDQFWLDVFAGKYEKFPSTLLVKTGCRLGDRFSEIVTGGQNGS